MKDSIDIIRAEVNHLAQRVDHAHSVLDSADVFIAFTATIFGLISILGIAYQITKAKEMKSEITNHIEQKNQLENKLNNLEQKESLLEDKLNQMKSSIEGSHQFYRNMLNSITIDVVKEMIFMFHSTENYDEEIIDLLLHRTYMRELMIRLHTNTEDVTQTANELHYFKDRGFEFIPEFKDLIETLNFIKRTTSLTNYQQDRLSHLKVEFERKLEATMAASNIR